MNITAESYGHAVILNLKGEIVEDTVAVLRQAVEHQLQADGVVDIVLNLETVPFVDSAGLEYLLDLQDQLAERFGQVKLLKVGENVLTILEITRLRPAFEIHDDVPGAVKAMQP